MEFFIVFVCILILMYIFRNDLVDKHRLELERRLLLVEKEIENCKDPLMLSELEEIKNKIKFEIELCDVDG